MIDMTRIFRITQFLCCCFHSFQYFFLFLLSTQTSRYEVFVTLIYHARDVNLNIRDLKKNVIKMVWCIIYLILYIIQESHTFLMNLDMVSYTLYLIPHVYFKCGYYRLMVWLCGVVDFPICTFMEINVFYKFFSRFCFE